MRITSIVLLALILFTGCENPGADVQNDPVLYRGRIVQDYQAPFLVPTNSLAKDAEATLVIDATSADGTVYGSTTDTTVYAATGGEALPKGTWVDNQSSDAVEVSLTSNLTLTFESLATVTVNDAIDMSYLDENGNWIPFAGSGVITCRAIATGSTGQVTLISTVRFAIGGDQGDDN